MLHLCVPACGRLCSAQIALPPGRSAPITWRTFTILRLAGAKSPDEGHMVSLSVSMPDKTHLVELWTFRDHGKAMSEKLSYTRKS